MDSFARGRRRWRQWGVGASAWFSSGLTVRTRAARCHRGTSGPCARWPARRRPGGDPHPARRRRPPRPAIRRAL